MPGRQHTPAPTYLERLRTELRALHQDYDAVLTASGVQNIDLNRTRGGLVFIGFPEWGWAPSDDELERSRMALLSTVRSWSVRFRLLFTNPTPTVNSRMDTSLGLLERWLVRESGDHSVPSSLDAARDRLNAAVEDLIALLGLVPADEHPVRLVVDPTP